MAGAFQISSAGLEDAIRRIAGFSERRMAATIATAMSRTAVAVKAEIMAEMVKTLDRPTAYTLGSLYVKPATASNLSARVWFKDANTKGGGGKNTPAADYLLPAVEGGARTQKRMERALSAMGLLPRGMFVVPAKNAPIDGHGNMPPAMVRAMLGQLRLWLSHRNGQDKKRSGAKLAQSAAKTGGQFFVVLPGEAAKHSIPPGVYMRDVAGRGQLSWVLRYVSRSKYRMRLNFYGIAQRVADAEFPRQFARAAEEQLSKLSKK